MTTGLSAADFRDRQKVKTLSRNPSGVPQDPLAEIVAHKKQVAALKYLDEETDAIAAKALEAGNRRIELEIEQQRLRAEQKAPVTEGYQAYIMDELKATRAQLAEETKARTDAEKTALLDRQDMLAQEIDRLQRQPASPFATVKQTIEEAKQLVALFEPGTGTPSILEGDVGLGAWYLKAQLDQKRFEIERDDRHNQWMLEREDKLAFQKAELELKEQQFQTMNRVWTETVPKLLDMAKEVVPQLLQRSPGAVPDARPQAATGPPPGAHVLQCEKCGLYVYYRDGWPGVFCPCGAEYHFTPDEPQPDEGA